MRGGGDAESERERGLAQGPVDAERARSANEWFAWIVTGLAAWVVIGVFLVARALNLGLTQDVAVSPYHLVGYAGLAAVLLFSIGLLVLAARRGRSWRRAFPPGYGVMAVGLAAAAAYIVLDGIWQTVVGVAAGIEGGFAPTRLLLLAAMVLIAVAPLRVALQARHDGRPTNLWPAIICAGLVLATIGSPGGFHPAVSPWLERPGDRADDDGEIWVMNADGTNQTRLIEAPGGETHAVAPAWSPDGTTIAWTRWTLNETGRDSDADVWIAAADGGGARPLAEGPDWQWIPHWSPDSAWVTYTVEPDPSLRIGVAGDPRPGGPIGPEPGRAGPAPLVGDVTGADLWRVRADGDGAPEELTNAPGDDRAGDYSADGTRIAFDATRDGNTEIYVSDADGANPVRLTNDGGEDWAPDWSPDGTRIVFNSDRNGNDDLFVMSADGSGLVQLTGDPAAERGASWSPDGQTIAYAAWHGEEPEIWSIAADGSNQRNLTRSPATWDGEWDAGDWTSDGRLAFARGGHTPTFAHPIVREDLGMATLLLQAGLVAFMALLVLRLGPPFGAFTVLLGVSNALAASGTDDYRFAVAAAVAGFVLDVLVRRFPARSHPLLVGAGSAALFVLSVAATVLVTTGLAWRPTLVFGALLAALAIGWGLSLLGSPNRSPAAGS
jgi:Tol biopolymer transport system component